MRNGGLTGLASVLVAAALAGLALLGIGPLAAGLFGVQVVIALAWFAVLDAKGAGGGFVLVVIASGVMDGVLGTESEPDVGRAAGVVGVSVVVCLLYQLARRPRVGVALSLAGAVSAITFSLCGASYIALRVESDGEFAVVAGLLGAGVALGVARVVDLVARRPAAVPGSRRGVVGLVAGVAGALLVGWAYGSTCHDLGVDHAIRIALVAAVIAVIADVAVDAVLSSAPPADARARSALEPLGILLPVVLAGPAAYVAGRILLG